MESLIDFLAPLTQLISTVVVILLFFAFLVGPLLKYLLVNHEIEQCKKRSEEVLLTAGTADLMEGHAADDMASSGEYQGPRPSSDRDSLDRLATSDPAKAGDLVKKWIKNG